MVHFSTARCRRCQQKRSPFLSSLLALADQKTFWPKDANLFCRHFPIHRLKWMGWNNEMSKELLTWCLVYFRWILMVESQIKHETWLTSTIINLYFANCYHYYILQVSACYRDLLSLINVEWKVALDNFTFDLPRKFSLQKCTVKASVWLVLQCRLCILNYLIDSSSWEFEGCKSKWYLIFDIWVTSDHAPIILELCS